MREGSSTVGWRTGILNSAERENKLSKNLNIVTNGIYVSINKNYV